MVLALAVFCGGCDDNPASPSTPPLVFSAVLSPSNEVPPVGNAESTGRGAAQIAFDGSTAHFYFQLTNFPADTRIVGAHIHPGAAGVNGPVVLSTGIVSAAPVALADGTVEFKASVPADAALVQAITANPAGYYFNVHSPLNPGGFARGQLTRVQ
ncbi:MAG: hypothetical protein A3H29_01125 [Acidobacteria bacterium RIFCSPLOWO2_02_FULL_67_21]|nr:MAG: hypothetical protein A3H29_01125 [Acidobacteria bacterium RIFCSPLOWO2_02_FULL_67_21]